MKLHHIFRYIVMAIVIGGIATRVIGGEFMQRPRSCSAHVVSSGEIHSTIQEAVDTAGSNDMIKVAGLCQGSVVFGNDHVDLTMLGGYDGTDWQTRDVQANQTIIDGNGSVYGVRINGAEGIKIAGFHLQNAYRLIDVVGRDIRIEQNWLHDTTVPIEIVGTAATPPPTLMPRAMADDPLYLPYLVAGGNRVLVRRIQSKGMLSPRSLLQSAGVAINSNGTQTTTNVIVQNNVIWNITAGSGHGIAVADDLSNADHAVQQVRILHNIIHNVQDDNEQTPAIPLSSSGEPSGWGEIVVINNVIAESGDNGIAVFDRSGVMTADHNCYHNATGHHLGMNNQFGDPLFADATNADFRLSSSPMSPCIDVGMDVGVESDVEGEPRPLGDGFDIGAYESDPSVPSTPTIPRTPTSTSTNTPTSTATNTPTGVLIVTSTSTPTDVPINASTSTPARTPTAPDSAPDVVVVSPADYTQHYAGELLILRGYGIDTEDGALSASQLSWSSDLDGALGSGKEVAIRTLSVGTHQLTLTGVDSAGQSGVATVSVTILP